MARIRYDSTSTTVLAFCECGWRELSLTKGGARAAAVDHERHVHPDSKNVRQAAWLREVRAARDTVTQPRNVDPPESP